MASKSKQKRLREMNKRETATLAVLVAMGAALLAIIQNSYGQFSDIRGFYGMHFADGQHLWPFSYHTLQGATEQMHPVEYPGDQLVAQTFLMRIDIESLPSRHSHQSLYPYQAYRN